MDKDSTIALQKIDCNCNDCKFLFRSFEGRQQHEDNHYGWQKDSFDVKRRNLLAKADEWRLKHLRGRCSKEEADEKYKFLVKEAKSMEFQFNSGECTLFYGKCTKNGLDDKQLVSISFIPGVLQLHTQQCFKHRSDGEV